MADKDFEPEDPFEPVAVALSTPGYDGTDAMARCFVEEYALMGWPPERVYRLFTIPEFAGSYSIMQQRGPEYVKSLIASVFGQAFEPPPFNPDVHLLPVLRRGQLEGGADGSGL
jgi:hypothetical protein